MLALEDLKLPSELGCKAADYIIFFKNDNLKLHHRNPQLNALRFSLFLKTLYCIPPFFHDGLWWVPKSSPRCALTIHRMIGSGAISPCPGPPQCMNPTGIWKRVLNSSQMHPRTSGSLWWPLPAICLTSRLRQMNPTTHFCFGQVD